VQHEILAQCVVHGQLRRVIALPDGDTPEEQKQRDQLQNTAFEEWSAAHADCSRQRELKSKASALRLLSVLLTEVSEGAGGYATIEQLAALWEGLNQEPKRNHPWY